MISYFALRAPLCRQQLFWIAVADASQAADGADRLSRDAVWAGYQRRAVSLA